MNSTPTIFPTPRRSISRTIYLVGVVFCSVVMVWLILGDRIWSALSTKIPIVSAYRWAGDVLFALGLGIGIVIVLRHLWIRLDDTRQELKESLEEHQSVIETAMEAIWVTNSRGQITYTNRVMRDLLGYPVENMFFHNFTDFLMTPFPAAIEAGEETKTRRKFDLCFVHRDGSPVWVIAALKPLHNARGEFRGMMGMAVDISDRRNVEEALQQSEARFRLLLQSQGEGTILFNLKGRFEFVNPAAERLFGVEPDTLTRYSITDFTSPENADELLQEVNRMPFQRSATLEWEIKPLKGSRRVLLVTITPWLEAHHELAGGLAVCRDITSRKQRENQLHYDSTHDALTGLFNRRFFEDELLSAGNQADSYPISLVVLDVDGLKKVNDALGHSAGDELLRRSANILKSTFRARDVIARIGGDEFAVLLVETDSKITAAILQRLQSRIDEANQDQEDFLVSLSFGAASAEQNEEIASIFQLADQQMYEMKQARRAAAQNAPVP